MKTVGILGGGQLGLMLANSVSTLGGRTIIYDPDRDAPALKHTNESVNGSWQDYELIKSFVSRCDIVTYEFENVEVSPLRPISKISPIYPSLDVLETTQNRIYEKEFLKSNSLPHVDYQSINSIDELKLKTSSFKIPFVIKIAKGGYDGKGQYLIQSNDDLNDAIESISKNKQSEFLAVLEEFVPISKEVSCIVARQIDGVVKTFPVFENVHKNHILETTLVPANLPNSVLDKVQEIALEATKKLKVSGLLTTEFFITQNDNTTTSGIDCGEYRIFINEFAPRPHNSGHVTRNACHMSQFDALARILLGIPLSSCELNSHYYHCMINILGDSFLSQEISKDSISNYPDLDLDSIKSNDFVSEVVLYGKKVARTGRKMGHLVAYGPSAEKALANAKNAKYSLSTVSKT